MLFQFDHRSTKGKHGGRNRLDRRLFQFDHRSTKGRGDDQPAALRRCFNSIIVRLKVAGKVQTLIDITGKFQFDHRSTKGRADGCSSTAAGSFQFDHRSTKGRLPHRWEEERSPCFNSIIVRLKVVAHRRRAFWRSRLFQFDHRSTKGCFQAGPGSGRLCFVSIRSSFD